jgi:predicted phosphate transport protein (TIGR00153 family)
MALTRDRVFWDAFVAHAACAVKAAHLLKEMLSAPAEAERLAKEIKDLEHQGDKITQETVQALHQTWITPLDREEIHDLISNLDDVLDHMDAGSDRIVLYRLQSIRQEAVDLASVLVKTTQALANAVNSLVDLKDSRQTLAHCQEVRRFEREADQAYRNGIAHLFNNGADAIEIMKWRDVLESLEQANDRADDAANIIEGIVLEHA